MTEAADRPTKRRRRAVGPPGAPRPEPEPWSDAPVDRLAEAVDLDDDARLRADRPPHHDQVR